MKKFIQHFDIQNQQKPAFNMVSVASKIPTHRMALATGKILLGKAFLPVKEKSIKKGDVLTLAEVSAIWGAKNTPQMLPLAHPLLIDSVSVHFVLDEENEAVSVYTQVFTTAKTGVEMEALAAVQCALLTIWDLCKGINPNLMIEGVRLLVKLGGKSGLFTSEFGVPSFIESQLPNQHFFEGVSLAVVVASDRASSGEYEDRSGAYIVQSAKKMGALCDKAIIAPDDFEILKDTLLGLQKEIIIVSGGTGIAKKDMTPEVMKALGAKEVSGFGEYIRHQSLHMTPFAVISRLNGYVLNDTLIITLPGSLGAAKDGLSLIAPLVHHSLSMISGKPCPCCH